MIFITYLLTAFFGIFASYPFRVKKLRYNATMSNSTPTLADGVYFKMGMTIYFGSMHYPKELVTNEEIHELRQHSSVARSEWDWVVKKSLPMPPKDCCSMAAFYARASGGYTDARSLRSAYSSKNSLIDTDRRRRFETAKNDLMNLIRDETSDYVVQLGNEMECLMNRLQSALKIVTNRPIPGYTFGIAAKVVSNFIDSLDKIEVNKLIGGLRQSADYIDSKLQVCPECKGDKVVKLFVTSVPCTRCKGTGSI